MTDNTSTDNTLTIRRVIKAPVEEVFNAWTRPQHLQHWWRAHPDWETYDTEVDLRVGGGYRLGMRNPEDGLTYICYGKFREVVPPTKLVYTWSWEPPGHDVGETLVTVEFLDKGDATELVLTHERFPTSGAAQEHNTGWTGALENFLGYVEAM